MTENSPTEATPSGEVFVSYASQDAAVANAIVETLEAQGIQCWIAPRDVTPGAHYADEIIGAISGATALILVLSDGALASKHVSKEVERASSKGRPIIAVRLGKAPLTPALEYFLSESQWIEAPDSHVAAALPRLVTAVQRVSHSAAGSTPGAADISGARPPADAPTKSGARWSKISGRKLAALAVIVVTTLAYYVAPKFWSSKRAIPVAVSGASTPTVPINSKSIAVLPFVDMSEKHDQEYFSDGLSENLITALTQFPEIKVIGRTSAFQFRESKEDAHNIGAQLGVARLLEGSVQHSGETVRVSAELVDTADGSTQWSDRYDRPYKDLFALQDDITRAVAAALRAKLLPGQHAAAQDDRPPSGSLEAYNALLQGRFRYARGTEADSRKAIEFYTQAIQLDPRYALAWSELSWVWIDRGNDFLENPQAIQAAYAKAREAADRALTLAPNLAAAHVARGYLVKSAGLDWRGAEAEFRRAMELAPNYGEAKLALGIQLAAFGELEQAIELTRQVLITEPLRDDLYYWLAIYFSGLNRLTDAERAIRQAIELQPTAAVNHWQLAVIEIQRGDAQAALAAAQQEAPGTNQDIALVLAQQVGTDRVAADAALEKLIAKHANRVAFEIAEVYALRNEPDKAFQWLDRAWINREPDIEFIHFDPFLLRFKDDPRFAAFCRKVGLPVPGERRLTS